MKLLVLCTGNTCRSQIAEGLLRNKFPKHEVFSAGTHPENMVNPYAMKAMMERDIDMYNQYPKLLDQFLEVEFDYVFTVCDSAKESCPIFPNAKNVIHHSFEDPSRSSYKSDQEAMEMYRKTVNEISSWIDSLDFL
jgi:arsenate reductase